MAKEILQLDSSLEGTKLNVIVWYPEGEIKGIILYAHGMIDQMRRHWKFGEFLADKGYVFIGNDHLGHGQTATTEKGYFADENGDKHLVKDQIIVADYATKRFPNVPLYVMGQSMGSFIARNFVAEYGKTIKGAIFASTGFESSTTLNFALFVANLSCLFLGKHHVASWINYMACLSNDKKFKDSKIPLRWLTQNYKELKRLYKEYPSEFFTFKAGAFRDMFRLYKRCQSKDAIAKVPKDLHILFVSGSLDCLGYNGLGVEKTASLYKNNGNVCKVILYDGMRHDLEAECHERYHNDVLAWINALG